MAKVKFLIIGATIIVAIIIVILILIRVDVIFYLQRLKLLAKIMVGVM